MPTKIEEAKFVQLAKLERLAHANELIRIIGSYGRRFFWNSEHGRFAYFEMRLGRVYLIDDYTGKAIYTHRTGFANRWRGFSHGGTLRSLVEDMRDYIMTGQQIVRGRIVLGQLGRDGLEGNIWGYAADEAAKVRELAYALPIIAPEAT